MASYDAMEFSKKLKLLAGRHRYSQATLAQHVGVSQNLVSLWMRGSSTPDLYQAAKISEVFGVDVNYLANDAQDEPTPPELSDGERAAVALIRAMGLDEQETLRRLATVPSVPGRAVEYRIPSGSSTVEIHQKPAPKPDTPRRKQGR